LVVSGNACVTQKNENDTMQIIADTIISTKDSLEKQNIQAHHNVKIFNKKLQAISDSLTFTETMNILYLYKKPIVWSENAELKGEKMVIHLKDSLVDKVEIFENTSALMELDSGEYFNQICGREMIAYFSNQKLKSAYVNGNAQTIFFPFEEKNTDTSLIVKRKGMNRLYAGDLRLDLDSGEVKGVSYIDKPDGKFYPMNKINKEEQFIKDFSWNPALRPKNFFCPW
jgi:hypothetical protein